MKIVSNLLTMGSHMDDRDEQLRQYLSTKYLTTPPEEVNPSTGVSSTSTSDSPSPEAPMEESTPGNDKAEAVKADGYANAADDSGLKAAQANRDRADLISNVGRSLSNIFTARAQANGYKPDDTVYNNIAKSGQVGVDEAQATRQDAIKAYLQKREMERQGVSDQYAANAEQRAQGEYDRKPIEAQKTRDFQEKELGVKMAAQEQTHKDTLASRDQLHKDAMVQHQDAVNTKTERQRVEDDQKLSEHFAKLNEANNKDAAEHERQSAMIQQAAQTGGGIAGNLLKGGALHEALGRVSQGELGMAVDPSLVERAKRLYGQIADGRSLTNADTKELSAILGATKQARDNRFAKDADFLTTTYDNVHNMPQGYAAKLVGYGQKPAQPTTTSSPGAVGGAPTATNGKGEKIQWNGSAWVPLK